MILKTKNGLEVYLSRTIQGFELSTMTDTERYSRHYIGYSKKEALEQFEVYVNSLRTKAQYEVISYDVWGNARDGFEVNQSFKTGKIVNLFLDATEIEIKRALIKCGFCNKSFLRTKTFIDGDPDYNLSIDLIANKYGGSYPFCELRKVVY